MDTRRTLNFLMRLLGFVAKTNQSLSRQSVNFIPMNLILIGVAAMVGIGGFAVAIDDKNMVGLSFGIPGALVFLAYVASILNRDTFFTGETLPAPTAVVGDTSLDVDLRWTGRLRLHEKTARRFLDVPAGAVRLEDGAFAIASNIDASSRFYGFVTNSKVGTWLSVPQPASFEIEGGNLFYGFRGAPAIRLKFVDQLDGKNATSVLAFDTVEARNNFASWLTAEKARVGGGAISSQQPQANLNSPFSSSTQN